MRLFSRRVLLLCSLLATRALALPVVEVAAANQSDSAPLHSSRYALMEKLNNAFLYPNNVPIAKAGHTDLFAEEIQGRVDITSTFDGMELNVEYIFGLFANLATSQVPTLLPVPLSWRMIAFASEGPVTTASAIFDFQHLPTNTTLPVQVDSFLRLDDEGRIQQYDIIFRRYTFASRYMTQKLVPYILANTNSTDVPPDQITPELISKLTSKLLAQSICATHTQYCLGSNQQYETQEACNEFLTTKIRLGQPDEMGMNTVLCRAIHVNMVSFRPDVHCPHVGPLGGGMCIDREYLSVVEQDYFKYSFIGGH